MSEIRDRVEKDWAKVMSNIPTMRKSVDIGSLIEVLLAHQDVAIVDRKAELPRLTYDEYMAIHSDWAKTSETVENLMRRITLETCYKVLKAGWIKEVKDE